MKTILIILDGLSEKKCEELNDMTPLEYAKTPTLDKIISEGTHGKGCFYPTNRYPDSLVCILSILGVKESFIPKNRAYLESLSAGIDINDDEVVLRCNLVSIKNDKLESFNAKGLSKAKISDVLSNIKSDETLKFYHISDYRNLIVTRKSKDLLELKDTPPHENVGQSKDDMLSHLYKIDILNKFIQENKFRFNDIDYIFYI